MAYSNNILPKSAAYYTLSNASISGTELSIDTGGFAEIQISAQMLPKLTSKMLVVAHPSVFSDNYKNDGVQITLSILTSSGNRIEYLIPVSYDKSGVFNTEIDLPDEEYTLFTYRISSKVPVVLYNWELCAEEAADLTTVIEGVEQELPKLLYDYNTYAYAVAQKELTVGLISCYLLNSTDLQGHFTLSFFATERCNVHVRIKDNGVTELFSPQVYTVERGYASISIPHAYLHKTSTDHAFSVTVQCTNGQLSIPVRGLLYTIDGGYLATRLLDAGVDIEDISVRQVPTDNSPSEIWAIGFEGNRLLLKKREYSYLQKANWTAVKDFGEGISASVEFTGHWISRIGKDKFTLETSSLPHVCVVSTDGILRAYYGSDFSSVIELDTGVDRVSSCQGFSSIYDVSQDQGLVVVYLKEGNVYYRQLLFNYDTNEYVWHASTLVYDAGDATFVSTHRLPDYRIGICVEHPAGTKWYITTRTYVSQGIKPEIVDISTGTFIIASVFDANKVHDSVEWPAEQNAFDIAYSYNNFIMTFDYPLVFLLDKDIKALRDSIIVSLNGTIVSNAVKEVVINHNVLTVILNSDAKAGQTITINLNCPYLVMKAYNNCLAVIKQSYTWALATPTSYLYHSDSVDVSASATLNALVRPIVTRPYTVGENVQLGTSQVIDLQVHEIKERPNTVLEQISANASGTLTLTVLQTGLTPL